MAVKLSAIFKMELSFFRILYASRNSSLPTCPLREEKSFSQRVFSIYTDIRKLQDKDKTSYMQPTFGAFPRRKKFFWTNNSCQSVRRKSSVWKRIFWRNCYDGFLYFFDRNVRYLEEKQISFIKSKVWTDCLKQDKRICHRRQKINGSLRRKISELYKDCFKKEISN